MKGKNEFKKNIIYITIIEFVNQINFYSAIAILYYTELTSSFMLGMSIFSITTISTAVFEFPTGILSDKVGRKKTIVIGSFFSVVSVILLLISYNFYGLIIFAIINGLENALFSGNNDAYVYDKLKEKEIEHKFIVFISKVKSMKYLAGAVSALIGGILLFFISYKFIIAISIIPKIIQLCLSCLLDETQKYETKDSGIIKSVKKPLQEVYKNKLLLQKIFADSIMSAISESCFKFRSAFYEQVWPTWAVGIPRVLSNIGAFVSNWFGEKIIKRIKKKKIIMYSVTYSIFSNIVAVIINNVLSPIVMVSNSLFQTDYIESEIEQKLYKYEYRASMGSIKSLFESIMFSILSVLLGAIADKFNIITSFVLFQILRIVPLLITKNVIDKLEKVT